MAKKSDEAKRILKKKINNDITNILLLFEKVQEWADLSNILQKLYLTIEKYEVFVDFSSKFLLFRRLSQCLNPLLPSGVHSKALIIYSTIFKKVEKNFLINNIHILCSGIFEFMLHCTINLKTIYFKNIKSILNLKENVYIFAYALLLSLFNVVDSDNNILLYIYSINNYIGEKIFFNNLWLLLLRHNEIRTNILNFLQTSFSPQISLLSKERIKMLLPCKDYLVLSSLIFCLNDKNILNQRLTLSLLINNFPLSQISNKNKKKISYKKKNNDCNVQKINFSNSINDVIIDTNQDQNYFKKDKLPNEQMNNEYAQKNIEKDEINEDNENFNDEKNVNSNQNLYNDSEYSINNDLTDYRQKMNILNEKKLETLDNRERNHIYEEDKNKYKNFNLVEKYDNSEKYKTITKLDDIEKYDINENIEDNNNIIMLTNDKINNKNEDYITTDEKVLSNDLRDSKKEEYNLKCDFNNNTENVLLINDMMNSEENDPSKIVLFSDISKKIITRNVIFLLQKSDIGLNRRIFKYLYLYENNDEKNFKESINYENYKTFYETLIDILNNKFNDNYCNISDVLYILFKNKDYIEVNKYLMEKVFLYLLNFCYKYRNDKAILYFLKNMLSLNLISYENIVNIFLHTFYFLKVDDSLFNHNINIYIKKFMNLLNIMTFFVEFVKHINKYVYIYYIFLFNIATLKLINYLNHKIIIIIKKYNHVKDLNKKYFIYSNDIVSGRHSSLFYFYFFVTNYNNYYMHKCFVLFIKEPIFQRYLNRKSNIKHGNDLNKQFISFSKYELNSKEKAKNKMNEIKKIQINNKILEENILDSEKEERLRNMGIVDPIVKNKRAKEYEIKENSKINAVDNIIFNEYSSFDRNNLIHNNFSKNLQVENNELLLHILLKYKCILKKNLIDSIIKNNELYFFTNNYEYIIYLFYNYHLLIEKENVNKSSFFFLRNILKNCTSEDKNKFYFWCFLFIQIIRINFNNSLAHNYKIKEDLLDFNYEQPSVNINCNNDINEKENIIEDKSENKNMNENIQMKYSGETTNNIFNFEEELLFNKFFVENILSYSNKIVKNIFNYIKILKKNKKFIHLFFDINYLYIFCDNTFCLKFLKKSLKCKDINELTINIKVILEFIINNKTDEYHIIHSNFYNLSHDIFKLYNRNTLINYYLLKYLKTNKYNLSYIFDNIIISMFDLINQIEILFNSDTEYKDNINNNRNSNNNNKCYNTISSNIENINVDNKNNNFNKDKKNSHNYEKYLRKLKCKFDYINFFFLNIENFMLWLYKHKISKRIYDLRDKINLSNYEKNIAIIICYICTEGNINSFFFRNYLDVFFILFLKIMYLNENISELNNNSNKIIQKEKNSLKQNALLEFKRDIINLLNHIFNLNNNKNYKFMKFLNIYYRQTIHHLLFLYYYFTVKKYYILQLQLINFIRYILPLYEKKNIDNKYCANENIEKESNFKIAKYNNYEEFLSISKNNFELRNKKNQNIKNDVFIFSILRKSMTIIFNINEQVIYKEVLKTILYLIENIIEEKEVKNYYLTVFFLDLLYIIKIEDQKKKKNLFFIMKFCHFLLEIFKLIYKDEIKNESKFENKNDYYNISIDDIENSISENKISTASFCSIFSIKTDDKFINMQHKNISNLFSIIFNLYAYLKKRITLYCKNNNNYNNDNNTYNNNNKGYNKNENKNNFSNSYNSNNNNNNNDNKINNNNNVSNYYNNNNNEINNNIINDDSNNNYNDDNDNNNMNNDNNSNNNNNIKDDNNNSINNDIKEINNNNYNDNSNSINNNSQDVSSNNYNDNNNEINNSNENNNITIYSNNNDKKNYDYNNSENSENSNNNNDIINNNFDNNNSNNTIYNKDDTNDICINNDSNNSYNSYIYDNNDTNSNNITKDSKEDNILKSTHSISNNKNGYSDLNNDIDNSINKLNFNSNIEKNDILKDTHYNVNNDKNNLMKSIETNFILSHKCENSIISNYKNKMNEYNIKNENLNKNKKINLMKICLENVISINKLLYFITRNDFLFIDNLYCIFKEYVQNKNEYNREEVTEESFYEQKKKLYKKMKKKKVKEEEKIEVESFMDHNENVIGDKKVKKEKVREYFKKEKKLLKKLNFISKFSKNSIKKSMVVMNYSDESMEKKKLSFSLTLFKEFKDDILIKILDDLLNYYEKNKSKININEFMYFLFNIYLNICTLTKKIINYFIDFIFSFIKKITQTSHNIMCSLWFLYILFIIEKNHIYVFNDKLQKKIILEQIYILIQISLYSFYSKNVKNNYNIQTPLPKFVQPFSIYYIIQNCYINNNYFKKKMNVRYFYIKNLKLIEKYFNINDYSEIAAINSLSFLLMCFYHSINNSTKSYICESSINIFYENFSKYISLIYNNSVQNIFYRYLFLLIMNLLIDYNYNCKHYIKKITFDLYSYITNIDIRCIKALSNIFKKLNETNIDELLLVPSTSIFSLKFNIINSRINYINKLSLIILAGSRNFYLCHLPKIAENISEYLKFCSDLKLYREILILICVIIIKNDESEIYIIIPTFISLILQIYHVERIKYKIAFENFKNYDKDEDNYIYGFNSYNNKDVLSLLKTLLIIINILIKRNVNFLNFYSWIFFKDIYIKKNSFFLHNNMNNSLNNQVSHYLNSTSNIDIFSPSDMETSSVASINENSLRLQEDIFKNEKNVNEECHKRKDDLQHKSVNKNEKIFNANSIQSNSSEEKTKKNDETFQDNKEIIDENFNENESNDIINIFLNANQEDDFQKNHNSSYNLKKSIHNKTKPEETKFIAFLDIIEKLYSSLSCKKNKTCSESKNEKNSNVNNNFEEKSENSIEIFEEKKKTQNFYNDESSNLKKNTYYIDNYLNEHILSTKNNLSGYSSFENNLSSSSVNSIKSNFSYGFSKDLNEMSYDTSDNSYISNSSSNNMSNLNDFISTNENEESISSDEIYNKTNDKWNYVNCLMNYDINELYKKKKKKKKKNFIYSCNNVALSLVYLSRKIKLNFYKYSMKKPKDETLILLKELNSIENDINDIFLEVDLHEIYSDFLIR
ncbi:conserved Plasmodium protein, unknown function [Plasmodium gallinaceum]|uniref:DOP1 N-terminal domain-containing protein n=1 Tax=Plasmodium gallinaceum TaxID=5849 RepID=A0A1J1GS00_PLAGA|nr:conserved Plasmodium protein, unknown function [Plasmodium gallinaceum]CRG95283.1 conserved Plasmodium protein, unknown function [Plasmodium gallinaceum]